MLDTFLFGLIIVLMAVAIYKLVKKEPKDEVPVTGGNPTRGNDSIGDTNNQGNGDIKHQDDEIEVQN